MNAPVLIPDRNHGYTLKKFSQLFLAGVVASVSMIVLAFLVGGFGIPSPSYGLLYGSLFSDTPSYGWGLFIHLLLSSILFPIAYDYFTDRRIIPDRATPRTISFSLMLWIFTDMIVAFLSGLGFLWSGLANNGGITLTSLICWLTYGTVLTQMLRKRVLHQIGTNVEKRAA